MLPSPEKVCARCQGTGFFLRWDPETKTQRQKECICTLIKVVGQKLGPELASAPTIHSPLFVNGKNPGEVLVDRTTSNLFLKGWWSDLLPHIKWPLLCKMDTEDPRKYFFHIVTDERLKSVWFDKEAYSARAKKKREDVPTFNSLSDLIGASYNLVLIRLGFLGYKNAAMPGILKEALMIRQALQLPTWLIEEPDSIFGPGHFSYSIEVGDYIAQRFEIFNFTTDRGSDFTPRGVEGAASAVSDEGMAVDEESESPKPAARPAKPRPPPPMPEERFQAPTYDPSRDSMLSGGSKFKKNSGFKKKPSGGGPI